MLKIIKVTGNSLSPFFLPGDYVLVSNFRGFHKKLRPGSTVVFNHPSYGLLIKHVHTNFPADNCLKVTGSNEESISTQKLGLIPYANLIGKVIFQIKNSQ